MHGTRRHAGSALKKTACEGCGRRCSIHDRRVRRVRDLPNGDVRIYLEFEARRVRGRCDGSVKGERLSFLATNPHYTKPQVYRVLFTRISDLV
ncbi:hypothetical protein E2553_44675 [Paraburkholderia dipogonis]|uniref:Transposase IS204/IS1001/IS1096/IS1165 zinc-finger domain-containing protein n=1 Tax=Paraburkholderia dipogonis TaxID=1211383 RepID=A0A4Y8MH25_9BURK|nr:hypothetical protein E2553_44675 [Paraburkholderia dipogonis]